MIRYVRGPDHERDGTYYPLVVCDACLRPLDDGQGNTYWLVGETGDIHPLVWHTHKGRCAALDRMIEKAHGGAVLFEELGTWLDQLRHNLTHPVGRP